MRNRNAVLLAVPATAFMVMFAMNHYPLCVAEAAVEVEQVEYKNLLPYQFEQRIKKMPLAYVPVGSLEWHGEHLCLGNDGIKVEELCRLAALKGGGIVLPSIYLGIRGMTPWGGKYRESLGTNGVFSIEPELLQRILTAELENLDQLGFKGAIVITGHYPQSQVELVKKVAADFKPVRGIKAIGLTDRDLAGSTGHTGDHAAKWETSILMALRPELVNLARLPGDRGVRLEGVYGDDPRSSASRDLGEKVVNVMINELCETGRRLVTP
jgi:creatinine amidohydrolase